MGGIGLVLFVGVFPKIIRVLLLLIFFGRTYENCVEADNENSFIFNW